VTRTEDPTTQWARERGVEPPPPGQEWFAYLPGSPVLHTSAACLGERRRHDVRWRHGLAPTCLRCVARSTRSPRQGAPGTPASPLHTTTHSENT